MRDEGIDQKDVTQFTNQNWEVSISHGKNLKMTMSSNVVSFLGRALE